MEPPLRQHPYASQSMALQRRYSFSSSAAAEIERSRTSSSDNSGVQTRSPRKSASFSSISDSLRLEFSSRSAFDPQLSPVHSPQRDRRAPSNCASDSDEQDEGFNGGNEPVDSESDSDLSEAYSHAPSDDESIASPSSSVAPSPTKELFGLLKADPLHYANVEKSNRVFVSGSRRNVETTHAPTTSDSDRTPARIEQEIREAIDSAAARVQEELGRRDDFENELRVALAYEPPGGVSEVNGDTRHLNENEGFDDFVASLLHSGSSSAQTPVLTEETPVELTDSSSGELLLIMEVVIGEGLSETIEVFAGDHPDVLAADFAAKHALRPEAVPTLSRHIQDQLDALADSEQVLGTETVKESEVPIDDIASDCAHHVKNEENDATLNINSSQVSPFNPNGLQVFPPPAPDELLPTEHANQQHRHHQTHSHRRNVASTVNAKPMTEQYESSDDKRARENQREYSYNCLMAKYGHYSQHSGKVDPSARPSSRSEGLTMRNIELAERTRVVDSSRGGSSSISRDMTVKPGSVSFKGSSATPRSIPTMKTSANGAKKKKSAPAPVFQRLYALAESKDKWIERAKRAKAAEEEREQKELQKHVVGSAARSASGKGIHSSGEFSNNRASGSYNHAGERLYEEALADLAKKERQREQRAVEREHQIDWMCPKCAYVNSYNDEWCKNVVSTAIPASSSSTTLRDASTGKSRRVSTSPSREIQVTKIQQQSGEAVCGQSKPAHLFRPTLMTAPAGVARAISRNKEKATALSRKLIDQSVSRRERSQRAMEEEFQRTCPFRPKINETSEEIVREKLEIEARAAGLTASPTKSPTGEQDMEKADADAGELLRRRQRRDPHLALYENAFQARANREAREREYMAQFPFKPDIGVNALWAPVDESQEAFVERLAVSKFREFERRREALVDKYAPRNRDPDTGRELFKPEVGRGPAFNRNERNLPIGDFLYEAHKEHREYLRQLEAQHELEIRERQSRGFVSESSRHALERRKKDTCARIFDALLKLQVEVGSEPTTICCNAGQQLQQGHDAPFCADDPVALPDEKAQSPDSEALPENNVGETIESTGDRVVHPRRIDLSKLPAEIGRVVAIIFEFAEYEDLTRAAFATHLEALVREVPGLTYTQVLLLANLLDDGKSSRRRYDAQVATANAQRLEAAELTFSPSIDKNSRSIATKHGRSDQSKVFLVLNQYFNHYKKKREQLARQQWREFEKTHPFQPTLVTKRQERQRAAEGFYERIAQLEEAQRPVVPPGPTLPTAIANARPCVRPIDGDEPPLIASRELEAPLSAPSMKSGGDTKPTRSGSGISVAPEDDDAALTSRVLAALDEAHAASAGDGNDSGSSLALLSALVREGISLPQ